MSVRPMISSRRRVCATSSSRHWFPLTTVIPSTSTCGDWIITRRVCMLLPPGPEQSSLMMTLRRGWAEAKQVASKSRRTREIGRRLKSLKKPQRRSRFSKGPIVFPILFPDRPRHQLDVNLVELFRIDVELDVGQVQIGRNLRGRIPEDCFAVAGAVIDVDIHIELFLPGDN